MPPFLLVALCLHEGRWRARWAKVLQSEGMRAMPRPNLVALWVVGPGPRVLNGRRGSADEAIAQRDAARALGRPLPQAVKSSGLGCTQSSRSQGRVEDTTGGLPSLSDRALPSTWVANLLI